MEPQLCWLRGSTTVPIPADCSWLSPVLHVKDSEYASKNVGKRANIQPAASAAGESELRIGRELCVTDDRFLAT